MTKQKTKNPKLEREVVILRQAYTIIKEGTMKPCPDLNVHCQNCQEHILLAYLEDFIDLYAIC